MEAENQRGLAHFLEHMAFKGSEHLPAGDLVQYLERLGMAFGADTNARTSYESTVFQLELPSNDSALVDKSLTVMRETADHLLIPACELEKERGVILSEKRLRDTPDYRAFATNIEFLLPGTLIPQRSPIGLDDVIEHANRTHARFLPHLVSARSHHAGRGRGDRSRAVCGSGQSALRIVRRDGTGHSPIRSSARLRSAVRRRACTATPTHRRA